jgi:hypothetical protein
MDGTVLEKLLPYGVGRRLKKIQTLGPRPQVAACLTFLVSMAPHLT